MNETLSFTLGFFLALLLVRLFRPMRNEGTYCTNCGKETALPVCRICSWDSIVQKKDNLQ